MTEAAYLRLSGVSKVYDDVVAVQEVSLDIRRGEFLTILGPSGSGKTTTLTMIAGFVPCTRGSIVLEGVDITNLPPYRRNIGMVFQNYCLFPHMSVAANVAFPLKMRHFDRSQIGLRVVRILEIVKLSGLENRYPSQLSGGQQQRVALARALVFEPRLLLMDEPLGALDKQLREQMQLEIKQIQRDLGLTVVYVTHDQTEALVMSDRIGVMNGGRVEQVDDPVSLYEYPRTRFVASFIGESNFFEGITDAVSGGVATIRLRGGMVAEVSDPTLGAGERVEIGIRPERISFKPVSETGRNVAGGVILDIAFVGDSIRYFVQLETGRIGVKVQNSASGSGPKVGEKVKVGWERESVRVIERCEEGHSRQRFRSG